MDTVTTWFLGTKKHKAEAKYHVLFRDCKNICTGFPREDGLCLLGVFNINQLIPAGHFLEAWLNDQYYMNWFFNGDKDEYQLFDTHEIVGRIKKVYE